MAGLVDFNKMFLYFYCVEVRIWVPGERLLAKSESQFIWIGPFFSLKERTQWKREFWRKLSQETRRTCGGESYKTLRFRDARRFKADINPKRLGG